MNMRFLSSFASSCALKANATKLGRLHKFSSRISTIDEPLVDFNISICQHESKGAQSHMEDRSLVLFENKLAAVFDGHNGDIVANELQQGFLPAFLKLAGTKNKPLKTDGVIGSISYALSTINSRVSKKAMSTIGSTAAISYINFDEQNNSIQPTIITTNVGDSRIVLSQNKNAFNLTQDHTPDLPKERGRIMAIGGKVSNDDGVCRVNGSLPLSRSIGDKYLKPYVSAEPEFREHIITPEDEFVIVATSGLWQMFSSQDAVDFVHAVIAAIDENTSDPVKLETLYPHVGEERDPAKINAKLKNDIAEALTEAAHRQDPENSDNISVIIQWIHHKE